MAAKQVGIKYDSTNGIRRIVPMRFQVVSRSHFVLYSHTSVVVFGTTPTKSDRLKQRADVGEKCVNKRGFGSIFVILQLLLNYLPEIPDSRISGLLDRVKRWNQNLNFSYFC